MRRTKVGATVVLALALLGGCASVEPVQRTGEFHGTCMPGDGECPICWRREGYPATAFLTAPVLLPAAYIGVGLGSPVALVDGKTRAMGVGADIVEALVAPVAFPLWVIGRGVDLAIGSKPDLPERGRGAGPIAVR